MPNCKEGNKIKNIEKGPILIALLIAGILEIVFFAGTQIDLFINPWIRELELQWWNVFTTRHFITWLFATNLTTWIVITSGISLGSAVIALIWSYIQEGG